MNVYHDENWGSSEVYYVMQWRECEEGWRVKSWLMLTLLRFHKKGKKGWDSVIFDINRTNEDEAFVNL